jgi:thiamine biosynthesis lipoprotein ApbE
MISATTVAASATDTDALATSFYVLGQEETAAYCKIHENVKAILVPHSDTCEGTKVVAMNFDRP